MISDDLPKTWRGHLFVAGLGIGQIVAWGSLYYAFPLVATAMAGEFGTTKPALYGAASLALLVSGLAAFPVGRAIDRGHGRAIMGLGALLGGALMMAWTMVDGLVSLYGLMAIVGLAQAMTLYEPAFAVIARQNPARTRAGITQLTLWAGFASTIFVPLTQILIDGLGWRGAVFTLGVLTILISATLNFRVIGKNSAMVGPDDTLAIAKTERSDGLRWALRQPIFWAIGVTMTLYVGTMSGFTFHLYPLLIERGLDPAYAVGLIACIGPAQVAGRVAIWTLARRARVRVIGMGNVLVFPLAFALLLLLPAHFAILAPVLALYGAANGIMTIVRGVALREMLTERDYGALNGIVAAPAMIAGAVAPLAAAALWSKDTGYDAMLMAAILTSSLAGLCFWYAASRAKAGGAK